MEGERSSGVPGEGFVYIWTEVGGATKLMMARGRRETIRNYGFICSLANKADDMASVMSSINSVKLLYLLYAGYPAHTHQKVCGCHSNPSNIAT